MIFKTNIDTKSKKDRQGHTGTTFMILGMRELKLAVIKLKMLHFWRKFQSETFQRLMQNKKSCQ